MTDVSLDATVGPLEVFASLGAKFDTMAKHLKDILEREADYQKFGPINVPIDGSGVAPATGSLYISIDGPPAIDRVRLVRSLLVGGTTWGTSTAGTANLYVSPSRPDGGSGGNGPLSLMRDQAPMLPDLAFYGAGDLVLRYGQRLWIEIVGGTEGQQYTVGGTAQDLPDRPLRAVAEV